MKNSALFLFLFFISTFLSAQEIKPSVVTQVGFGGDINTRFRFSHLNNYFYGTNDIGEFILWELRSGRQVKKLFPVVSEFPTLYYTPRSYFSDDEKTILIPEYPQGNYLLYNVEADKVVQKFTPSFAKEKFTHAFVSRDGLKILFVSQVSGDNPYCRIELRDLKGELLKNWILMFPKLIDDDNLMLKIIMSKSIKTLERSPLVSAFAASPDLDKIWAAPLKGNIYQYDLASLPTNQELNALQYTPVKGLDKGSIFAELTVTDDKIVAKKNSQYRQLKDKTYSVEDSIFVLSRNSQQLETAVKAFFYFQPEEKRANSITTAPLLTGQTMSSYFQTESANGNMTMTSRDLFTNKEIFRYKFGSPVRSYTNGTYLPGQLNGGYVVAISDDQSLIAECTGDLVVHNVNRKSIQTFFPLTRGNLKLNTPVFLDSSRLFIPKTYDDGFVVNLRSASVSRLKTEIDCQDTARYGQNVHNQVDPTSEVGLQNSCLSPNKKVVAIVNFIPNDLCNAVTNKVIEVYQADQMKKIAQYPFHDMEYTYHLNMISEDSKKFLVNYKLFDFSTEGKPTVKDLKIVQKKDTFFAVNPVYIPSGNYIFSILGTRVKPGNPTLMFAQWDLDGKLIKSVKFDRKKSNLEFQTAIFESQLSPDGKQLLFGLADGTAGIFNIPQMAMGSLFEHGKPMEIKALKLYSHTMIISGCFIDDDHFVTSGNDGQINLWSISEKKLVRSLTKDLFFLYGLVLSPDKKYLVGTNIQKSVVFLNISTGEIDLRFIAFDYESYALINKDGFYTGNKKSSSNLSFFFKSKSYEFSQFDLHLNRPDKIIGQLGFATKDEIGYYKKAYDKRLSKMGYKENTLPPIEPDQIPQIQLSGLPPDIRETNESKISFTLNAVDNRNLLKKAFVSVNGIPLFGSRGMELKSTKPGSASLPVNVPLSYGINKVEVSVMNNQGAESLREFFTIKRLGAAPKPDLYIISVGSGQFVQAKKNLKYPSKDAKDLVDLFKEQSANFGQITNLVFQNEKVTRAALLKTKELLRKTKPDDMVLLFFAGHGMLDKNLDYFLSTYNTDFTNPALQAISYQDLEGILDSIPARNKIMFLDACNSGEVDKENTREYVDARTTVGEKVFRSASDRSVKEVHVGAENSFTLMQALFSDLRRSTGASVISAASAYENAVEGDQWQNGVFTYSMKRGLKDRKADINKDGKINLSELMNYLNGEVSELTNGNQQPTSRAENIINDPVIWK